jgi:hypothetical protein
MQDSLPTFSVDLIDELDKAFPHQCAKKGEALENIWRYAGMRELVDILISIKDAQERNG